MSDSSLKTKVMHSLKWVALGKVFTQAVRWLTTFWVIRLLMPEDYALVAMADVFSGFLTLIAGAMFNSSIIRDRQLTHESLRNIFGLIIVFHLFFFTLQLALAVPLGIYYEEPRVSDILVINAVILLINMFSIIPASLLNKEMAFKKTSLISAFTNIVTSLVTLALAYNDFGFWAIILGEITNKVVGTLLLLIVKPAFYIPCFRFKEIKGHILFGSALTVHSIIFYIFLHIDVFIAGRVLTLAEVGFYAVATQIALMPQRKMLPLLKNVAFPAFSSIQTDAKSVAFYIYKAQRICFLITIPVFWGLASIADTVIPLILGDKWSAAVVPAMLLLVVMPLRFSEELFNPALKSIGAVGHMIKNVVITMTVLLVALYFTIEYKATGLALAWGIAFPLSYCIVLFRNSRKLQFELSALIRNFVRIGGCGAVMVASVYATKYYLPDETVVNLVTYIVVGGISYFLSASVLYRTGVDELKKLIKRK